MAHSMPYPSSIVHGLSTCWFCTYTPSRVEEAVVTGLTGLEKTEDWRWKRKKLNTQGGWTLQESRVDFASLCTVVPWDLHSQNKNSQAKLLRSSRIVPWRIYWFLVLRYSRGGTSGVYSGWQLGAAHWLQCQPRCWEGWVPWRGSSSGLCQHGDWVLLSGDPGRELNCI